MSVLPPDLDQLISSIEAEEQLYPERQSDLEALQRYLANGDIEMAESLAERILEQQRAVRQIREQGVPAPLQQLLERIEQDKEQYPERQSDLEALQRYLANGDIEMAESMAERILEQQRAVRQIREQGVPAALQHLFERIEQDQEQYPERQSDLEALQRYLANGDIEMAESIAERILEQQQAVRQLREQGVPASLQQLLERIEQDQEQYPERQSDLEALQRYLANGDIEMAESMAERLLEQQRAVRHIREQGVPAALQNLFERIEQDQEQYPERQSDLEALQRYLANGDIEMAESMAERILEQQRAVKKMRE